MRSVFRLLAVRNDTGFRYFQYMLEAQPRSLALIPLPRRWLITSNLFFASCMVPVVFGALLTVGLVVSAYSIATFPAGVAFTLLVIIILTFGSGWSQRLYWKLFKPPLDKALHPEIKDIKPGRFHSTLTVETEEGIMTLVVQARHRILTQALDMARKSGDSDS
jgi:hypothetical protein